MTLNIRPCLAERVEVVEVTGGTLPELFHALADYVNEVGAQFADVRTGWNAEDLEPLYLTAMLTF